MFHLSMTFIVEQYFISVNFAYLDFVCAVKLIDDTGHFFGQIFVYYYQTLLCTSMIVLL